MGIQYASIISAQGKSVKDGKVESLHILMFIITNDISEYKNNNRIRREEKNNVVKQYQL